MTSHTHYLCKDQEPWGLLRYILYNFVLSGPFNARRLTVRNFSSELHQIWCPSWELSHTLSTVLAFTGLISCELEDLLYEYSLSVQCNIVSVPFVLLSSEEFCVLYSLQPNRRGRHPLWTKMLAWWRTRHSSVFQKAYPNPWWSGSSMANL